MHYGLRARPRHPRRTKLYLSIVAAAVMAVTTVAAACQPRPAPAQHGAGSIRFQPCGESAGGVVECAQLSVRERPGDSTSRQLALRVVRLRKSNPTPATSATLVLAGGPGSAAPEMARGDLSVYMRWAEHGDVVFMDQRGTEDESPLRCAVGADFDPFAGIFPMEALARCRGEAVRVTDLAAYGTSNAAEDIEAARVALGYDQLNFVAVSYGTRLAMEYMERYPDRVRATVLDGVVPRELRAPLHYVADAEAALQRLADVCLADERCRQFGDPAARYRTILARLAGTPATPTIRTQPSAQGRQVTMGPEDFAYAVRGVLYGNNAIQLPRLLHHADSTGDLSTFARTYAQRAAVIARTSSLGLHLSVLCAEDIATLTPQQIRDVAATTVAGSYLADQYVAACDLWRVPPGRTDTASTQLTRPLLLLSGALDPVTPPRWAELVRARSTNARHVIFPYGGHSTPGIGMEDCKARLVLEFLRTARPEDADAACAGSGPPPDFLGPSPLQP